MKNAIRMRLIVVTLVVASAASVWSALGADGDESDMPLKTKVTNIDSSNPLELRDWSRLLCRGWSISDLAATLDVEPNMDAVVESLGRGLSGDQLLAVREGCEAGLAEVYSPPREE